MSYILGALKKAEKERRRDRSLDLNDWDQETWENPVAEQSTQSKLLWLVFSTLLILVVLIGWLAFQVLGQNGSENVIDSAPKLSEQSNPPSEPQSAVQQINVRPSDIVPVHIQDQYDFQEKQAEESPLPAQAQVSEQALPEFSGHIYFAGNAALSRVFSGAESYREGDVVQGYEVESILETEVVLSRAGQQYEISLTD